MSNDYFALGTVDNDRSSRRGLDMGLISPHNHESRVLRMIKGNRIWVNLNQLNESTDGLLCTRR